MAAAAGEAVPLLRFESLCGALRTGLTEAITLKTESDKGAAAFLALQSSAMGLIELKEVPPPPSPQPPSPPPPRTAPTPLHRLPALRHLRHRRPRHRASGEPHHLGEGGGGEGLVQGGVPGHGRR